MFHQIFLKCTSCGKTYPPNITMELCSECKGFLTMSYNFEFIKTQLKNKIENRSPGVWRFFELLPLEKSSHIISLGEGGTYLQRCDKLAKILAVRRLYVKNETTNPTGSFIDRGVTVAISKAKKEGFKALSCVPTGNFGASLAAYTAKAGLKCIIFLSPEIDLGKLYQMIAYDAEIVVESSFKEAFSRMEKTDRGSLITPVNPYFLEGEKTIGFEICEQLGWITPSRIVVPMGTGGLISMIWKGIREMDYTGLIHRLSTKMIGIQSNGCCPIVEAFKQNNETIKPFNEPKTLAIDIKVGDPILGQMALRTIRDSGGTAATVSDSEILEATRLLAKTEGIFAEPSAASTIAGVKKLREMKEVDGDEDIVCIITGAGLKDLTTAKKMSEDRRRVRMLIESVEGGRVTTRLGETKTRILKILSNRELHGYGIWKKLTDDYELTITLPSVYQHLAEMEILGLLRKGGAYFVVGNRKRHYYTPTEEGLEVLKILGSLKF